MNEKSERGKADRRGGVEGNPVESEDGAVDGFESFVACGGFWLRRLAAVCLGENKGMFVVACVLGVVSSKMRNVIDDAVEKVEF